MSQTDFNAPRLFVDAPLSTGAALELDRDQANYLGNVLRLVSGSVTHIRRVRRTRMTSSLDGSPRVRTRRRCTWPNA